MKHLKENLLILAATVWLVVPLSPTVAATHFDETVPGPAAAVYHELVTFQTPSGVVGTELTVARAVVTQPTGEAGLFRIQPSPGSGRTTADVTVGGSGSITEDSGAVTVATVIAQLVAPAPTVATGYEMVEIIVSYQSGYDFSTGPLMGAETWSLQALQVASSHRYAGFVGDPCTPVSATNCPDEVTLPRLSLEPSTLVFGDVQTNLPTDVTPITPYTIENVGTADLTMTGPFAPAGTPFSVSGSFPASLVPMGSTEIDIQFRPTALGSGANQANVNIASNDPASPTPMSFSGTGVTMNAALLLDLSGSMNSAPTSSSVVPEPESRLGHAKQGGFQLFEIYRELTGGQANFGLYGYPDPGSPNVWSTATATTLVSMRSGNAALGPVGVALDAAPPVGSGTRANGMTPMAEGIKRAEGGLNTSANQRPLILLLADGDHNLNSTSGPATPEAWVPSLVGDGIRMFTIAYGVEGADSGVSFDRLERLAADTSGEALPADATTFGALNKSFRSALQDWLGLGGIDPNSTINANQNKTHNVCIDRSDYTATFVVDWGADQANAIAFTLVSSTGEVITPSTPGISYRSNDTYAFYVIKGERIRGGAGAGNWQMRLTGASDLGANTKYSYSVLTGTPYVPKPQINPGLWTTGYALPLAIDLSHLPKARYSGLQLRASYDMPAESFRTFVSEADVDWETVSAAMFGRFGPRGQAPGVAVRERANQPTAKATLLEPASSIYEAKVAAIRASDGKFSNQRKVGEMQLYDDGTHGDRVAGDGIFVNNALTFANDGLHQFHVFIDDLFATPTACLGRDFTVAHYVDVGLDAELLVANMAFEEISAQRFFDPSGARYLEAPLAEGFVRRALVVSPKDRFGNLWGPGRAERVAFALDGARAASPVYDQGDGSYLQLIDYATGSEPMAWATVGDVTTQAVSVTELGETAPDDGEPPTIPTWILIALLIIVALGILIFALRRSS